MKRFSRIWWIAILFSSVIGGVTIFLLFAVLTDWSTPKIILVVSILTLIGDLIVALSMEAVAPTKVNIGPGERNTNTDLPSEFATVISGFKNSPQGQVSVRGETWRAIRAPEDSGSLSEGSPVQVVDRNGLTLVISTKAS